MFYPSCNFTENKILTYNSIIKEVFDLPNGDVEESIKKYEPQVSTASLFYALSPFNSGMCKAIEYFCI